MEYDGRKLDQPQLAGKWDESLSAMYASGAEQALWTRNPPHAHPSRCGVYQASAPTPQWIMLQHASVMVRGQRGWPGASRPLQGDKSEMHLCCACVEKDSKNLCPPLAQRMQGPQGQLSQGLL